MGWDGWVLHWGSAANRDEPQPARISIAIEFQRHPRLHAPMNQPLMPLSFIPDLYTRLGLVCKQVRNYAHIRESTGFWVEHFCGSVDEASRRAGLPTLKEVLVT